MNVFGHATDPRERWTAPFPEARIGVKLRLLGGDLLDPDLSTGTMRPGREAEGRNWFTVIPGWVRRAYYPRACKLFLSARAGRFGFYVGHKVFGVDLEMYLDYPGVGDDDVYVGSRAMSGLTARFSKNLGG